MILGIKPKVRDDEVEISVSIEISRGDSIPPTFLSFRSGTLGESFQFPFGVLENSYGVPFAGENKIDPPIIIDIRPDRAGHNSGA